MHLGAAVVDAEVLGTAVAVGATVSGCGPNAARDGLVAITQLVRPTHFTGHAADDWRWRRAQASSLLHVAIGSVGTDRNLPEIADLLAADQRGADKGIEVADPQ